MIQITDRIFVGNSDDLNLSALLRPKLKADKLSAVLNVACDLYTPIGLVEYMHVGLIDGPGNPLVAYSSAVLALVTLMDRHERVLVCCHSGGRSLAVAVMHSILKAGRVGDRPSMPHYWRTWQSVLDEFKTRCGVELPIPHAAHREAADKLPYGILEKFL